MWEVPLMNSIKLISYNPIADVSNFKMHFQYCFKTDRRLELCGQQSEGG